MIETQTYTTRYKSSWNLDWGDKKSPPPLISRLPHVDLPKLKYHSVQSLLLISQKMPTNVHNIQYISNLCIPKNYGVVIPKISPRAYAQIIMGLLATSTVPYTFNVEIKSTQFNDKKHQLYKPSHLAFCAKGSTFSAFDIGKNASEDPLCLPHKYFKCFINVLNIL